MHKPRKLALAVLASITIAGIAGASASSLGGLTSQNIGSDDDIVASCDDNGINVAYSTTFNAATNKNMITGVQLSAVEALCDGQTATVRLGDGAGNALSDGSAAPLTVSVGGTASISVTPVDAELVNAVSLVIQG